MTTQRTPRRERISYYRDCSAGLPVWCYAMTVDGEHDHADTVDDVDGSATAASVAEALAAHWPSAELVRVSDAPPDLAVVVRRLRQLRSASEQLWAAAVDTCDEEWQAECRETAEAADESWAAAIEAAEGGQWADATSALEEASSSASDWGDASHEAEGLAMLRAAEGGER